MLQKWEQVIWSPQHVILHGNFGSELLNILGREQIGWQFAYIYIFKCIFFNERFVFPLKSQWILFIIVQMTMGEHRFN